jgi:hypothetical protein
MPHNTNIPEDPSKEAELQNVMSQIKALSGGVADEKEQAPTLGPVPAQAPDPPPAAPSILEPPATPQLKRSKTQPFKLHDVAQVTSKEGRYFGVLFQVGDIKGGEVHGYTLKEHGGREYITAKVSDVTLIGESKVRLKTPCSPKWIADHGGQ